MNTVSFAQKPETMTKDKEKVEERAKKEAAQYEEKKVKAILEHRERQKLDLEKPSQDIESKSNQQGRRAHHRATVSRMEKIGTLYLF